MVMFTSGVFSKMYFNLHLLANIIKHFQIEICQNVEPHKEKNSVKSQAVVKFEAVRVPVKFTRLQCNTDLNMPPSNWLSSSPSSHGLQQFIYHSSGFASFRMAHMFPDCLGEVDVVSDAENIKNLLKLPYAPKTAVSMMVHRIGNTLLIDEFDIQKYLLRQADDDWKWLRNFIVENILSSLSEKDRNICIKDKSRGAVQRKNLLSKFLYHTLQQANQSDCGPINIPEYVERIQLPLTGPVLPEPNIEENVPDPQSNHVFSRNVVWTFEDIRMLIGTDMPIFGGGTRPCISLRLRDMAKPINVLTGIDYWLDNLMCNVPEVVMCYHLDGIVQKYELIKTEDLPYLEDSQFSPQVVRNVAQNILAFLKANATKAGHTYWLFKGKNDDVVKLYDLTTLSRNEDCGAKYENPFTVPVAMLLYRVARNMKDSSDKISPKKAGSIKALLDNCIKLLSKEKYPQIVTSSHYILSDLHIPAGLDPRTPNFENPDVDSDQSIYDDDYATSECDYAEGDDTSTKPSDDICTNVAVKNICETLKDFKLEDNWKNDRPPSPLIANVEERCNIALQHVFKGMDCLKYFASNEEEIKQKEEFAKEQQRQKIIHEEQHPIMAKPFLPIPLPYESLKPEPKMADPDIPIPLNWNGKPAKSKKKQKGKNAKEKEVKEVKITNTAAAKQKKKKKRQLKNIVQGVIKYYNSWDVHLKVLLTEKACLIYTTLAERNLSLENYGISLKYIYMALRCQEVVTKYMTPVLSKKNYLFGRAGDAFFQFAKNFHNFDMYIEQFLTHNDIDDSILTELEKDVGKDEQEEFLDPIKDTEELMLTSCTYYEYALDRCDDKSEVEILRRLGNVRNEMGVRYMHSAQDEYRQHMANPDREKLEANPSYIPLYQDLATQSFESFLLGISSFEDVYDSVNLAFLLCNMGRYLRFRAHIHFKDEKADDIWLQKKHYKESFAYYKRALGILGSRDQNPELWDVVTWELSTATFTLSTQVQDFITGKTGVEDLEQEAINLLQQSIKLCDIDNPGPRQLLYRYRTGTIHNRLASFYHIVLRKPADASKKRTTLQVCRLHYEKAAKILENLKEINEFLEVQLGRIALQDYLADDPLSCQKKKHLQTGLEICIQTKSIFDHISMECCVSDQTANLMTLFERRLQGILRILTKACLSQTKGKEPHKLANLYKTMYSTTLNILDRSDRKNYAKHLSKVLEQLSELKKSFK